MADRGEAGARVRAIYRLAHALHLPLSAIDEMSVEEIRGHLAYLDFMDETRAKARRRG